MDIQKEQEAHNRIMRLIEDVECPVCGSYEKSMSGILGKKLHLHCRHCGIDYSVDVD